MTVAPGYTDPGRLSYNPPGVFRTEFDPGQLFKFWRVSLRGIQAPDIAVFGDENGRLRLEAQAIQRPVHYQITSVQDFPRQSFTATMEAYLDPQSGGDFGSLLTFGVMNTGAPAPQGWLFCGQSTQIQSGPFPEGQSGQQILVSACSTFATPQTTPTNIGAPVPIEDLIGHPLRFEIAYDAVANHVSGRIVQRDTGREIYSSAVVEAQNPSSPFVSLEPFERFRFAFGIQAGSGGHDPASFRPGRSLTYLDRFESSVMHEGFYTVSHTAFELAGTRYDDLIESPVAGGRGPAFLDAVDLAAIGQAGSPVAVVHDETGLRHVDGTRDVNAALLTFNLDPPLHLSAYTLLSRLEMGELLEEFGPDFVRIDAFFKSFKANGPGQNYTWLEPPVIEGDDPPPPKDFINSALIEVAEGFTDPGFLRPVPFPPGALFRDTFDDFQSTDETWFSVLSADMFGRLADHKPHVLDGSFPQIGNVVQSGGALYTEAAGTAFFSNVSRLLFPVEGTDLSVDVLVEETVAPFSSVMFGYKRGGIGPASAAGCPRIGCARLAFEANRSLVNLFDANGDARDTAGGSDGALANDVHFVEGRLGQALEFDGKEGFVFGKTERGFPNGDQPRTITALVKLAAPGGSDRAILEYGAGPGPSESSFRLFVDRDGRATAGPGPTGYTVRSTTRVDDGQWHLIMIAYAGFLDDETESRRLRVYVDGVEEDNQPAQFDTGRGVFRIGSFLHPSPEAVASFPGAIDEIVIFSRSLTPQEVETYTRTKLFEGRDLVFNLCGITTGAENLTGGDPGANLLDFIPCAPGTPTCAPVDFARKPLTFKLSVHDGMIRGEILERKGSETVLLYSRDAPLACPAPSGSAGRPIVMSSLNILPGDNSGIKRPPGVTGAKWDNLLTNIPLDRIAPFEISASPLAVDGVPFNAPFAAVFLPDAPSEDPNVERIRAAAIGILARILSGRSGPAQGNDVADLSPITSLLTQGESSGSLLPIFVNRDRTVLPLSGNEIVHALLLRNPDTGVGATILFVLPSFQPPPDSGFPDISALFGKDAVFFDASALGPDLNFARGLVANLYVGQGPGKPFRFQLPPAPRGDLVGMAIPEEVVLLPTLLDPPDPTSPFGSVFPAICLFADRSVADLSLIGSLLSLSDDPLPATIFRLLQPQACIRKVAYLSSRPDVLEFASIEGKSLPFFLAKAPGEAQVTVKFNGVSNTSRVKVVKPPLLLPSDSDPSTDPNLLQIVGGDSGSLVVSHQKPQHLSATVRAKPFVRVSLTEPVETCSNIFLSDKTVARGSVHANENILISDKATIEGDAIHGPGGQVIQGDFKKLLRAMKPREGDEEGVDGEEDEEDGSQRSNVPSATVKGKGKSSPSPLAGEGGGVGEADKKKDRTLITGQIRKSPTVRDCGRVSQGIDLFRDRVKSANNKGNLVLKDKMSLVLEPGEYYFDKVDLRNKATVTAKEGAKIVVGDSITLRNKAQIAGSGEWFMASGSVEPPVPPPPTAGLSVAPGGTDPGFLDFVGESTTSLSDGFSDAVFDDLWLTPFPTATQSGGFLNCSATATQPCFVISKSAWPPLGPTSVLSGRAVVVVDSLGGGAGIGLAPDPLGEGSGPSVALIVAPEASGSAVAILQVNGVGEDAEIMGTLVPGQTFRLDLQYNHAAKEVQAVAEQVGVVTAVLTVSGGSPLVDGGTVHFFFGAGEEGRVRFDSVETNLPVTLPPYAASNSPLQKDALPYTDLTIFLGAPTGFGSIFLLPPAGQPPDPSNIFFVTQDGARIDADGVTDINGALVTFQGACGPDPLPSTQRATIYTTLDEATLQGLTDPCVSLDHFEPVLFKANGFGSPYTWTLEPPPPPASATIDPPTQPSVVLRNKAVFNGTLIAPNATVLARNKAEINGALLAGHYVGTGKSVLASSAGFLPRTVLIPLAGSSFSPSPSTGASPPTGGEGVGGGGSGIAVTATLDYRPADFGPFGVGCAPQGGGSAAGGQEPGAAPTGDPSTEIFATTPCAVGTVARTVRASVPITGTEIPDADGFVTVHLEVAFDAKDDAGALLPSSAYEFSGNIALNISPSPLAGEGGGEGVLLASIHIRDGRVKVDNTPPRQMLFAPRDGQIQPMADLFILGFTDDPKAVSFVSIGGTGGAPTDVPSGTGLSITSMSVGGIPLPLPLPGLPGVGSPKLKEGANEVTIVSRDALLNESRRTYSISVDTVPPTARMEPPVENLYTQAPQVDVAAALSDPSVQPDPPPAHPELVEGSGLAMDSIKLLRTGTLDSPSVPLPLSPSCTAEGGVSPLGFPFTLHCSLFTGLAEGPNLFRLSVRDAAGHGASDGVFVDNDTTPAESRVIFPPEGVCLNTVSPNLIVLWRDPEPGGLIVEKAIIGPDPDEEIADQDFELPAPGFVGPLGSGFDVNTALIRLDRDERLEAGIQQDRDKPIDVSGEFHYSGILASNRYFLSESAHTLEAQISDHLGNRSPDLTRSAFTLDVTAPVLSLAHSPAGLLVPTITPTETTSYFDPQSELDHSRCNVDPPTLALAFFEVQQSEQYQPRVQVLPVLGVDGNPLPNQPAVPGPTSTTLGLNLPEGLIEIAADLRDAAKPLGNLGTRTERFIIDVSGPSLAPTPPDSYVGLNANGAQNPVPPSLVVHAVDNPVLPKGHAGVKRAALSLNVTHQESPKKHTFTAFPQFGDAVSDATVIVRPFTPGPAGDFTAVIPESLRNETAFPDGHYAWTTTVSDRLNNVTTQTFNFCIDRAAPTLTEFDVTSPVDYPQFSPMFIASKRPLVHFRCNDVYASSPSCGVLPLRIVATRTAYPAGGAGDDPIPLPADALNPITMEFEDPTLCDGELHVLSFPKELPFEGVWTFALEAKDAALNLSKQSKAGFYIDVTAPYLLPQGILLLDAGTGLPIPPYSTITSPTNRSAIRAGVRYTNGLSGVNPATVVFSRQMGQNPACNGTIPLAAVQLPPSHEALSQNFLPCEGTNTISVFLRDKAGNPFSDSVTLLADYTPPRINNVTVSNVQICTARNWLGSCTASVEGIRVSASVTDATSGVNKVELLLNSTHLQMSGSYSIDVLKTTYDAASDVRVQATDFAGNLAELRRIGPNGGVLSTANGAMQLAIPAGSTAPSGFIGVESVSQNTLVQTLGYNPFDESTAGSHLNLLNGVAMTLSGNNPDFWDLPEKGEIRCKKSATVPDEQIFIVDFLDPHHRYDNEGRVRVLAGVNLFEFSNDLTQAYYIPLLVPDCPGLKKVSHALACVSLSTDHGKTQLVHGQIKSSASEIRGQVVVVDDMEAVYPDFAKPRMDQAGLQSPSRRVWGSPKHFGIFSLVIGGTETSGGTAGYCIPAPASDEQNHPDSFFQKNGIGLDHVRIAIGTDGCDVTVPVKPIRPEDVVGGVLNRGTCDARYIEDGGACEQPPIVPPAVNGGPPDTLNLASETYGDPNFVISGRNGIAGITVHVDLRGKVPAPPGSRLDLFVRNATSANKIPDTYTNPPDSTRQFYVFQPIDVAGFSAGAITKDNPQLFLNARLRRDLFAPNACRVFGRMAQRRDISASIESPAGNNPVAGFIDLQGATANYKVVSPGNTPDSCYRDSSQIKGDPCEVPGPGEGKKECKACYPGGPNLAQIMNCPTNWFDDVDPNTCQPTRLQRRFMEMTRAGTNATSLEFIWASIEPLEGRVTTDFTRLNEGNLDAYVAMAKPYNIQITGLLANSSPFWASSCCSEVWTDAERASCRRSDLDSAGVAYCTSTCSKRINDAFRWYNDHRAGYKGTEANQLECKNPDLRCAGKAALLAQEKKCHPALIKNSCEELGAAYHICAPEPDPLREHVRHVVNHFRPGGTLANQMGWGNSYGITTWQYQDEHNAVDRFNSFTDYKPLEGPGSDWDVLDRPSKFLVHSPGRYKADFKVIFDCFYNTGGPACDLNLDSSTRLVVSGPLVGLGPSICPEEDKIRKANQWAGASDDDDLQRAIGCFGAASPVGFYSVMNNSNVGGYSLAQLGATRVIAGVNTQSPAIAPGGNEDGRGAVPKLMADLRAMMPNLPIWMMTFGSCDGVLDPFLICGGRSSGQPSTPGPYALAAEAIATLNLSPGAQSRGFWFGYADRRGEERGDLPTSITMTPPFFKPLYYALSVAPRIKAMLSRTYEFRTGLELSGNVPRVYVEVPLEANHTYRLRACARPLDVECKAWGSMQGCFDPCQIGLQLPAGDVPTCRTKYESMAPAVYGSCPGGQVPVHCPDGADDTALCGYNEERPSMPFSIKCAPLGDPANQTTLRTECNESGTGSTGMDFGADFSTCFTPEQSTGVYSCEIAPVKIVQRKNAEGIPVPTDIAPFVPTEGETNDPINNPNILLTPENTLSLFEDPNHDGVPTLKTSDQIAKVLRAAEGAYVEGVIRFELVNNPMSVASRRARAP